MQYIYVYICIHIILFQSQLFVLFEHAAGYALFKVNEFEETGMLLPQVEASVTDLNRFNSVVKLVGFSPFKTAMSALENMNSISEGGYLIFVSAVRKILVNSLSFYVVGAWLEPQDFSLFFIHILINQ